MEEAIKFIKANRNRPFFAYLPHTMPHIPLFASEKFKGTITVTLADDRVVRCGAVIVATGGSSKISS